MPPQSRYRARPRDRRQAMRSLTSLHESRVYSPENFWSPVQKDFCNNICQEETHALQQTCLQSITLFARRWNDGGIVRPNALAVQTLITNSNFVGCVIGKS